MCSMKKAFKGLRFLGGALVVGGILWVPAASGWAQRAAPLAPAARMVRAPLPKLSPLQLQKLDELRKRFADPKYTFKLGQTGVSHLPLAQLTGGRHQGDAELKEEALRQNAKAKAWLAEEKRNLGSRLKSAEPSCANKPRYDLRKVGLSSPVQGPQLGCGSCWAFASVAALESSWKMVNGQDIGASEQNLLSCAVLAGSCGGGIHSSALLHLMFQPLPSRDDVPYIGKVTACNNEATRRYAASIWAFVGTSGLNPSTREVKEALCSHGALAAAMNATDAFKDYTLGSGVFNEMDNPLTTNHVVTIIGWDDSKHAWLIKNSWGEDWGINPDDPASDKGRGYGWIDWGSNLIGRSAAWVKARKACPNDGEYDAGLCYKPCRAGYHGLGPMCWKNCPPDMLDDGATCRAPIHTIVKKSQGRGVGTPMGCAANEELNGALCYPRCNTGYKGVGPVCWQSCRDGYHDDGATCRKDAHIFGSDNSKCPWYDKCGLVTAKGCSKCPADYHNDGCTCRRNVDIYAKKSYGRGVGSVLHTCDANEDKSGALCYPKCPAGYSSVGPVCWEKCPTDHRDDGAFCTKGGQITASPGYGRGVGTIPP